MLQVNDILVVNKSYASDGPDALTLRRGDLVEVLDTGTRSATDSKYVYFKFSRSHRANIFHILIQFSKEI